MLISTCDFKESSITMWYGCTEGSYIWRDLLKKQWKFGFREGQKISCLADWLLAFQEGLFCMKLIVLYSSVTRPKADTVWQRMNCDARMYISWRQVPHFNHSATRISLIIYELLLLRAWIAAITEWALTFSRYWPWILLSSGFDVVYSVIRSTATSVHCCDISTIHITEEINLSNRSYSVGKLVMYNKSSYLNRNSNRILAGTRFSAPIQTGPETHPAFCRTGVGSLSWE
jgi:hypothetical protein